MVLRFPKKLVVEPVEVEFEPDEAVVGPGEVDVELVDELCGISTHGAFVGSGWLDGKNVAEKL